MHVHPLPFRVVQTDTASSAACWKLLAITGSANMVRLINRTVIFAQRRIFVFISEHLRQESRGKVMRGQARPDFGRGHLCVTSASHQVATFTLEVKVSYSEIKGGCLRHCFKLRESVAAAQVSRLFGTH